MPDFVQCFCPFSLLPEIASFCRSLPQPLNVLELPIYLHWFPCSSAFWSISNLASICIRPLDYKLLYETVPLTLRRHCFSGSTPLSSLAPALIVLLPRGLLSPTVLFSLCNLMVSNTTFIPVTSHSVLGHSFLPSFTVSNNRIRHFSERCVLAPFN